MAYKKPHLIIDTKTGKAKIGICFRCMYKEHQHCYGTRNGRICTCQFCMHDLHAAKVLMGRDPYATPPDFPEEPDPKDYFYFV